MKKVIALLFVVCCALSAYGQSEFNVQIIRTSINSNSVTGELFVNGKFLSHTLELPWKDNASFVSSIPNGTYSAFLRYDKKDAWRIQLDGVPKRPGIQIHIGNYPSEIEGCILVGDEVFNQENRLSNSTGAYNRLKTEFYGTDAPISSPNKKITVTVKYNLEKTEFSNRTGVVWRYSDSSLWLQGPDWLENKEYKRDLKFIYIKYRGPNFFIRIPLHGGTSEFSNKADGPWTKSEDDLMFKRNNL